MWNPASFRVAQSNTRGTFHIASNITSTVPLISVRKVANLIRIYSAHTLLKSSRKLRKPISSNEPSHGKSILVPTVLVHRIGVEENELFATTAKGQATSQFPYIPQFITVRDHFSSFFSVDVSGIYTLERFKDGHLREETKSQLRGIRMWIAWMKEKENLPLRICRSLKCTLGSWLLNE